MKVKLQPPTGSDLLAYNPLSPPASISQIMLLANPTKVQHVPSIVMYTVSVSFVHQVNVCGSTDIGHVFHLVCVGPITFMGQWPIAVHNGREGMCDTSHWFLYK